MLSLREREKEKLEEKRTKKSDLIFVSRSFFSLFRRSERVLREWGKDHNEANNEK